MNAKSKFEIYHVRQQHQEKVLLVLYLSPNMMHVENNVFPGKHSRIKNYLKTILVAWPSGYLDHVRRGMLKTSREKGVLKSRREKISAMARRIAQMKGVFEVNTQRVRARLMVRAH